MRKINPAYVKEVCRIASECPYFKLQSLKLLELDIGHSLLEIDLAEKHLQTFGVVHGGVFSTIIDAAAFWAVFLEADENLGMTTVDLNLNYLAPATTGKLIAEGTCIKLGKTLGLGAAKVTDESGKMLAHGTSTLMVIPNFPFGPTDLPSKFL
jgi:uncharacterized protein (TIGR00369 family)